MDSEFDVVLLDGYVDEPSTLGVPPYISPQIRMITGCLEELKLTWKYITADQYRKKGLPGSINTVVYGGVTVPGKYLRGSPLSPREVREIGTVDSETFLGGPIARYEDIGTFDHTVKKDMSAYIYEHLSGEGKDRWCRAHEMERWLKLGAKVVNEHPDHPDPLIAEIGLYRGCVRYLVGGCSFCSEPNYGKPRFRKIRDVVDEISALYSQGVRNFRIGGQSCTISYMAEGVGKKEVPKPRPESIRGLFEGIWKECPGIKTLHLDNANPAVISTWPSESRRVLEILVKNTTPGNVLALGMESADPEVIYKNNLNSTPEQVREAVEIINRIGATRGKNGMPMLLPGLNFIGGLKGETKETYSKNFEFLEELKSEGMVLRRINIRQVLSHNEEFKMKHRQEFKKFKRRVREEIDRPMLKRVVPRGTVVRDVYMEKREGSKTFGRQIGTYPLLVGIEYPVELETYKDVIITDYGYRSITGLVHPFELSKASYQELKAVPGIGEGRAAEIFKEKPTERRKLEDVIGDKEEVEKIMTYTEL